MKKILKNFALIMVLGLLLISAGCGGAKDYYDLSGYTPEGNGAFTSFVNSMNTPSNVATWIYYNLTYQTSASVKSPYNFWKSRVGDCSECAALVSYISHQLGYPTYQIYLTYTIDKAHRLCAIWMGSEFHYSSTRNYYQNLGLQSFAEIIEHYDKTTTRTVEDYTVFDWNGNIVQEPADPDRMKSRGIYDGE